MTADGGDQVDGQAPELNTLVLCDLANFTALVEKLGDQNAARLIRKHDRMARALLDTHLGREIDKTDGFLLLFVRPIQAVAFALDYLRGLAHLSTAEGVLLRARVGVHMGEVLIWQNPEVDIRRGAKPIEIEGLAKPIAARLAQMALPGQILLSAAAAGLARRAVTELDTAHQVSGLSWKHHGRYRFKGVPDPLEVIEVGERHRAPLRTPSSTRNARRLLPLWRHPLMLAIETTVLLVTVSMGLWFDLRSPSALVFAARDWVVVTGVQNHSGVKTLNDVLDTAVRISLSQSRYVNVVPGMEVAATLQRMRLPANTPITRQIGIQIAQRQGARAVIVPVLNSVGGQLQVAAEVVDPKNNAVVYTDSAVVDSSRGLLPTTDRVLREVRSNLGESLIAIGKTSAPLAAITTSNLDALRAYSTALQALGDGQVKQAMLLLNEAIHLDPHFALALSKRAAVELAFLGDRASAYRDLQVALQTPNRLSLRECLGVEGMFNMVFGQLDKAINKYSLLSSLYPDAVAPQQNLGVVALWYTNQQQRAARYFRLVTRSRDPQRGAAWFGLALAEIGMGNRRAAVHAVQQGWQLGTIAPRMQDLLPLLVAGDYAMARKRLHHISKTLPSAMLAAVVSRRADLALVQGDDPTGANELQQALDLARKGGDVPQQETIELAQRALGLYTQRPGARTALRHYAEQLVASFKQNPILIEGNQVILAARTAMLARVYGLRGVAEPLLKISRSTAFRGGYPSRESLWNTASCYTHPGWSDGQRTPCLKALVNGHEYAETHIALMDLYRRSGKPLLARYEALWLDRHRGLALVELHNQPMLIPNLLALRVATNILGRGVTPHVKQKATRVVAIPVTSSIATDHGW